jgi:Fe2+ or Zn2+ uptake regulation protein
MGDIETLKSAIVKKKNFTPDYLSIRIFGLCQTCQRDRSGHAVKAGRAKDVN